MAIIKGFGECRPECEGAAYSLQLLTDHRNLEYFMIKDLLNRHQARRSEFWTRFEYQIVHRPGKSNWKADALMRRLGDLPEGGDERVENMEQMVLKLQNVAEQLCWLAVPLFPILWHRNMRLIHYEERYWKQFERTVGYRKLLLRNLQRREDG